MWDNHRIQHERMGLPRNKNPQKILQEAKPIGYKFSGLNMLFPKVVHAMPLDASLLVKMKFRFRPKELTIFRIRLFT